MNNFRNKEILISYQWFRELSLLTNTWHRENIPGIILTGQLETTWKLVTHSVRAHPWNDWNYHNDDNKTTVTMTWYISSLFKTSPNVPLPKRYPLALSIRNTECVSRHKSSKSLLLRRRTFIWLRQHMNTLRPPGVHGTVNNWSWQGRVPCHCIWSGVCRTMSEQTANGPRRQ